MSRWISVDERRPDAELDAIRNQDGADEVEVLVMISGAKYPTALFWDGLGFWDAHDSEYKVTHWMPLPKPPDVT